MNLSGKTIVITGAASGIGRALALRFARETPRALVLADLPAQMTALRSLADELARHQPGVPTLVAAADVGHEADVTALVAAATHGHVGKRPQTLCK